MILLKRGIFEQTFGWLNQNRLLSKDYELLPEVNEAMIQGAMSRLMLQCLRERQEDVFICKYAPKLSSAILLFDLPPQHKSLWKTNFPEAFA